MLLKFLKNPSEDQSKILFYQFPYQQKNLFIFIITFNALLLELFISCVLSKEKLTDNSVTL